jgi:hypothetical protein
VIKPRALKVLALLLTLAVIAACSPSEGEEDGAQTTIGSSGTTVGESQTPDDTQAPDEQDPDDFDFTGECLGAAQAMAAAINSYAMSFAGTTGGGFDADEAEQVAGQLQAMADAAPDEIKADLEVIGEALSDYFAAIAEIGLQPGGVPTEQQIQELTALQETFDQEAFDQASNNVQAWFDANC